MRNLFLFCILLILLSGCLYSPYADEYFTEEPRLEDVVGVYKFDKQTVNYNLDNDKIKSRRPMIIIKADKTYEIKEIPYFRVSANDEYNYINGISKKGKWMLETIGSVDYGSSGIKKHWGITLDSIPEEIRYAGLLGENKANGVIFKYGDPDEGSVMIFRKEKN
ncbi:hypothetical protein [Adhaeribacter pallidiroseus]|uniref:Lipoprotein n=1 Tax=Adhaeribacter pallidiroseus TaxID=2072847 RepID=A0A369QNL7_9BACT|nr:hypothetical protein [Adhaeribacter pallidiroseus]RDC65960.1 hypothetical protein AHMF7616_04591 [Adhaeribacter pallidiroseus]